jgi:hypothetical protein
MPAHAVDHTCTFARTAAVLQAAEATAAQLTTELGVTRDELTRTGAVAARAAAADAKIVKAEGVVPAGKDKDKDLGGQWEKDEVCRRVEGNLAGTIFLGTCWMHPKLGRETGRLSSCSRRPGQLLTCLHQQNTLQ